MWNVFVFVAIVIISYFTIVFVGNMLDFDKPDFWQWAILMGIICILSDVDEIMEKLKIRDDE